MNRRFEEVSTITRMRRTHQQRCGADLVDVILGQKVREGKNDYSKFVVYVMSGLCL